MNLAVVISLPIIAIFGVMGFRDGVVKRVLEILGVFATLILTARFASAVNPWMMDKTGLSEGAALLISWAALFFAGLLLSRLLATLMSKMIRLTILGWIDRLGGAVVGMALGLLVASVFLLLISHVPGGQAVKADYDDNSLGAFIYFAAPSLYQSAREFGGLKVDELWDRVLEEAQNATEKATEKAKEAVEEATQDAREKAEDVAKEAMQQ